MATKQGRTFQGNDFDSITYPHSGLGCLPSVTDKACGEDATWARPWSIGTQKGRGYLVVSDSLCIYTKAWGI